VLYGATGAISGLAAQQAWPDNAANLNFLCKIRSFSQLS
jgi:hypothetical protein